MVDDVEESVVNVEVHPLAKLLCDAVASGAIERGTTEYAAIYAIVMRRTGTVQRLPWSQAIDPAVWRPPMSLTNAAGAATTLAPLFAVATEAFVGMRRSVYMKIAPKLCWPPFSVIERNLPWRQSMYMNGCRADVVSATIYALTNAAALDKLPHLVGRHGSVVTFLAGSSDETSVAPGLSWATCKSLVVGGAGDKCSMKVGDLISYVSGGRDLELADSVMIFSATGLSGFATGYFSRHAICGDMSADEIAKAWNENIVALETCASCAARGGKCDSGRWCASCVSRELNWLREPYSGRDPNGPAPCPLCALCGGYTTAFSVLRPCLTCKNSDIVCRRCSTATIVMDAAPLNLKAMAALRELPRAAHIGILNDIKHTLTNVRAACVQWYLRTGGVRFNMATQLMDLRRRVEESGRSSDTLPRSSQLVSSDTMSTKILGLCIRPELTDMLLAEKSSTTRVSPPSFYYGGNVTKTDDGVMSTTLPYMRAVAMVVASKIGAVFVLDAASRAHGEDMASFVASLYAISLHGAYVQPPVCVATVPGVAFGVSYVAELSCIVVCVRGGSPAAVLVSSRFGAARGVAGTDVANARLATLVLHIADAVVPATGILCVESVPASWKWQPTAAGSVWVVFVRDGVVGTGVLHVARGRGGKKPVGASASLSVVTPCALTPSLLGDGDSWVRVTCGGDTVLATAAFGGVFRVCAQDGYRLNITTCYQPSGVGLVCRLTAPFGGTAVSCVGGTQPEELDLVLSDGGQDIADGWPYDSNPVRAAGVFDAICSGIKHHVLAVPNTGTLVAVVAEESSLFCLTSRGVVSVSSPTAPACELLSSLWRCYTGMQMSHDIGAPLVAVSLADAALAVEGTADYLAKQRAHVARDIGRSNDGLDGRAGCVSAVSVGCLHDAAVGLHGLNALFTSYERHGILRGLELARPFEVSTFRSEYAFGGAYHFGSKKGQSGLLTLREFDDAMVVVVAKGLSSVSHVGPNAVGGGGSVSSSLVASDAAVTRKCMREVAHSDIAKLSLADDDVVRIRLFVRQRKAQPASRVRSRFFNKGAYAPKERAEVAIVALPDAGAAAAAAGVALAAELPVAIFPVGAVLVVIPDFGCGDPFWLCVVLSAVMSADAETVRVRWLDWRDDEPQLDGTAPIEMRLAQEQRELRLTEVVGCAAAAGVSLADDLVDGEKARAARRHQWYIISATVVRAATDDVAAALHARAAVRDARRRGDELDVESDEDGSDGEPIEDEDEDEDERSRAHRLRPVRASERSSVALGNVVNGSRHRLPRRRFEGDELD